MRKEENKTQQEELALQNREEYKSPIIEVVEIELEQNLFAGSDQLPGMGGEDW